MNVKKIFCEIKDQQIDLYTDKVAILNSIF